MQVNSYYIYVSIRLISVVDADVLVEVEVQDVCIANTRITTDIT